MTAAPESFEGPLMVALPTCQLVSLLQTHRGNLSDDAWDALDGTPLGDALDSITDLEWEVEENNYQA